MFFQAEGGPILRGCSDGVEIRWQFQLEGHRSGRDPGVRAEQWGRKGEGMASEKWADDRGGGWTKARNSQRTLFSGA